MTEPTDEILTERESAWLEAAGVRRSRRTYRGERARDAELAAIEEVCLGFRRWPDARVELVRSPAVDVFRGVLGAYGKVTGAPHLLVVIADTSAPFHRSHAGYTGEAVVLEAAALGLDTCWVGGFFNPSSVSKLVELATHERALCVSPLGHATHSPSMTEKTMSGMADARRRKPAVEIAPGVEVAWPEWAQAAVNAARIAPSAMNRQPWRFRLEDGTLIVARDSRAETPKVAKALDCGIAMLHAELGARSCGILGRWEDLDTGLDIARYVPEEGS